MILYCKFGLLWSHTKLSKWIPPKKIYQYWDRYLYDKPDPRACEIPPLPVKPVNLITNHGAVNDDYDMEEEGRDVGALLDHAYFR